MTVAEAIKLMKKSPTQCLEASEAEKFCEAYDMAIRSLEAWDRVVEEIVKLHDNDEAYWNGVYDCLKIINEHLKGVTKCK